MSSGNGQQQSSHIPYAVVPLIAIVAAAGAVMIVFVFYRHATEPSDPERAMSEQQAVYMQEVRQRNRAEIQQVVNSHRARRGSRHW